jgi:hypothetical protein
MKAAAWLPQSSNNARYRKRRWNPDGSHDQAGQSRR